MSKAKNNDDLPNIKADGNTELQPQANNSAKEMSAKIEEGAVQLPLLDNKQAKEAEQEALKKAVKAKETVKVMKPVKDANGMVIDFEEVEVPVEQAKAQFVPGGLTNQARYVETNARLQ